MIPSVWKNQSLRWSDLLIFFLYWVIGASQYILTFITFNIVGWIWAIIVGIQIVSKSYEASQQEVVSANGEENVSQIE